MVVWLTPSFGDRVEHGERPPKVARGILLCAWFVKHVVCEIGGFGRLGIALQRAQRLR